MKFDIVTIFPEAYDSYLNTSILARAQAKNIIDVNTHSLRNFGLDKRGTVDDRPYGGGAGMVLRPEPILRAVDSIKKLKKSKVILFSAKGKPFNQKMAMDFSKKYNQLIFVCGRYEGVDERVAKILKAQEVSVGPYVLTDGDIAAMTVISAVSRLLPGAIRLESLAEESHWNLQLEDEQKGALEYPHYTRPEVLKWKSKNYKVPKVLLSGHHAKVSEWRREQSLKATKKLR